LLPVTADLPQNDPVSAGILPDSLPPAFSTPHGVNLELMNASHDERIDRISVAPQLHGKVYGPYVDLDIGRGLGPGESVSIPSPYDQMDIIAWKNGNVQFETNQSGGINQYYFLTLIPERSMPVILDNQTGKPLVDMYITRYDPNTDIGTFGGSYLSSIKPLSAYTKTMYTIENRVHGGSREYLYDYMEMYIKDSDGTLYLLPVPTTYSGFNRIVVPKVEAVTLTIENKLPFAICKVLISQRKLGGNNAVNMLEFLGINELAKDIGQLKIKMAAGNYDIKFYDCNQKLVSYADGWDVRFPLTIFKVCDYPGEIEFGPEKENINCPNEPDRSHRPTAFFDT
jgi:hypothetical protein